MEPVTLKMLQLANEAYPGDIIAQDFNMKTGEELDYEAGDTLGLFIGREIISVVEGTDYTEEQANEAVRTALIRAIQDIDSVIQHLTEENK